MLQTTTLETTERQVTQAAEPLVVSYCQWSFRKLTMQQQQSPSSAGASAAADSIRHSSPSLPEERQVTTNHTLVSSTDLEQIVDDNDENSHEIHPTATTTSTTTTTTTAGRDSTAPAQRMELICCVVFCIFCYAILELFTPHERPIPFQVLDNSGDYVRNLVNNETLEGETVSTPLLIVISVFIPVLLQIHLALCTEGSPWWSSSCWCTAVFRGGWFCGKSSICHEYDVHATVCVYLVTMGLNHLATDAVKLYVGYLRPIFYNQCQPTDDYSACTNNDTVVDELRKSFPSGHASTAFAGLSLLTLYLHTRWGMGYYQRSRRRRQHSSTAMANTHTYPPSSQQPNDRLVYAAPSTNNNDTGVTAPTTREGTATTLASPWNERPVHTTTSMYHASPEDDWTYHNNNNHHDVYRQVMQRRLGSVLALLPMALALFIAASRVVDNKHFPADVVGGAVLGASIASFTHNLWFG